MNKPQHYLLSRHLNSYQCGVTQTVTLHITFD